MLDVLIIWLLARSRGRIAEERGHPRSAGYVPTVLYGLGFEIPCGFAGYLYGGETYLLIFGAMGLGIGLTLAVRRVDRLPVVPRSEEESPEQTAGHDCAQCGEKIVVEADGRYCADCNCTVHRSCRSAHRKRRHKMRRTGRARGSMAVDGSAAAAAPPPQVQ